MNLIVSKDRMRYLVKPSRRRMKQINTRRTTYMYTELQIPFTMDHMKGSDAKACQSTCEEIMVTADTLVLNTSP